MYVLDWVRYFYFRYVYVVYLIYMYSKKALLLQHVVLCRLCVVTCTSTGVDMLLFCNLYLCMIPSIRSCLHRKGTIVGNKILWDTRYFKNVKRSSRKGTILKYVQVWLPDRNAYVIWRNILGRSVLHLLYVWWGICFSPLLYLYNEWHVKGCTGKVHMLPLVILGIKRTPFF